MTNHNIKKIKIKNVKKATENLNPKRGMNQPNSNKNWKSDPKSILQCFIKWKQQVRGSDHRRVLINIKQ